jgi:putative transposase
MYQERSVAEERLTTNRYGLSIRARMARKARAEVEGGLYHVITRGNNRRQIFNSPADYEKFLSLLAIQKAKLTFFLYAYCLMTNHVHLLLERQASAVGQIMHRLLTGYAQYYNRQHRRVGHLFQGRHRAILCQSERYLSQLVRYIHLNPVRAGIVSQPEEYEYSSHRAYLGMAPAGIVDVDPVLRHFGAKRKVARDRYRQFVAAGIKQGHCEEFYAADDGRILGSEEFVDATIHRIGETGRVNGGAKKKAFAVCEVEPKRLVAAVEKVCRVSKEEFCSTSKRAPAIIAKEMAVLVGVQIGASMNELSELIGISPSALSRRHDAARRKLRDNASTSKLASKIIKKYKRIAKSQASP